tara:strand:- start:322 stop:576 length:255 start_codon:yes stop_codon:yes gene_type:complete
LKLVQVFRSQRKENSYLYVEQGCDLETLPTALREMLGKLEPVLSMRLTPERRLARYHGAQVLEAIAAEGFFLQLPPSYHQELAC